MEELEFKFTKDEAQVILNALLEQKCGTVLFVVNKLQEQAAKQIKQDIGNK